MRKRNFKKKKIGIGVNKENEMGGFEYIGEWMIEI